MSPGPSSTASGPRSKPRAAGLEVGQRLEIGGGRWVHDVDGLECAQSRSSRFPQRRGCRAATPAVHEVPAELKESPLVEELSQNPDILRELCGDGARLAQHREVAMSAWEFDLAELPPRVSHSA
jgi:hypothetical protein